MPASILQLPEVHKGGRKLQRYSLLWHEFLLLYTYDGITQATEAFRLATAGLSDPLKDIAAENWPRRPHRRRTAACTDGHD